MSCNFTIPIKPNSNNAQDWINYTKQMTEYYRNLDKCYENDFRETEANKYARNLPTYQAIESKKINIIYIVIPLAILLIILFIKK